VSYWSLASKAKRLELRGVWSGRNARERQFIKGEMGRNKFTNQAGRNEIKRDKKNKELGLPQFVAAPGSHGQDTYRFWEAVSLGAVPVALRGPLDGLYSQVPSVLVDNWWRPITPADLVAWRQNLTERFGDLDAATRTARRTVLNSTFWAEQIRGMA